MSLRTQIQQMVEPPQNRDNTKLLADIIVFLAEEIDNLRSELELVQKRCDRNRDTSSDWRD